MGIQHRLSTFYSNCCLIIAIFELAFYEMRHSSPDEEIVSQFLSAVYRNRQQLAIGEDAWIGDSSLLKEPISVFVPGVKRVREMYREAPSAVAPGTYVVKKRYGAGDHFICATFDGTNFISVEEGKVITDKILEVRGYSFR